MATVHEEKFEEDVYSFSFSRGQRQTQADQTDGPKIDPPNKRRTSLTYRPTLLLDANIEDGDQKIEEKRDRSSKQNKDRED